MSSDTQKIVLSGTLTQTTFTCKEHTLPLLNNNYKLMRLGVNSFKSALLTPKERAALEVSVLRVQSIIVSYVALPLFGVVRYQGRP